MGNAIPTARLEAIRDEMAELLSDFDGTTLQDGYGALAAFYNSLSIGEVESIVSELLERRNKDAQHG